jgi:hypothetical protein
MSRWWFASMVVGTGLAWSVLACAPTRAQDKPPAPAGAPPERSDAVEGAEKRIDQAIQKLESRADQELDQSRKELEQMRQELRDLNELHFDLGISMAELQAELAVKKAHRHATDGGAEQERQRTRVIELCRELRRAKENLRSVVQQKKDETEQQVLQLRNLRAQLRQSDSESVQFANEPPARTPGKR